MTRQDAGLLAWLCFKRYTLRKSSLSASITFYSLCFGGSAAAIQSRDPGPSYIRFSAFLSSIMALALPATVGTSVDALVEELRSLDEHVNESVAVCSALTALCNAAAAVLTAGALKEKLADVINVAGKHAGDRDVCLAAFKLLGLVAAERSGKMALTALLSADVAFILSCLSRHMEHESVAAEALGTLQVIFAEPRHPGVSAVMAQLPAIIAAARRHEASVSVAKPCCQLLRHLTGAAARKEACDRAGAAGYMSAALAIHGDDAVVAEAAAIGLGNLAPLQADDDARALLAPVGSVLLRHVGSVPVTSALLKCLTACISGRPDGSRLEAGVARGIVAAMSAQIDDAETQERGLGLLDALVRVPGHRTALAVAGVAPAVLRALREHSKNPAIVSSCCHVLHKLSDHEADLLLLAAEGAAATVFAVLLENQSSSKMAEHLCGALVAMLIEDGMCSQLQAAGALPAVVAVLKAHVGVLKTAIPALAVVSHLAATGYDGYAALAELGVCDVAVAMLRAACAVPPRDRATDALRLCKCLAFFCQHHAAREQFRHAGLPAAVVGVLRLRGLMSGEAEAACHAVSAFCVDADCCSAMCSAGAAPELVSVLLTFAVEPDVVSRAALAVYMMASVGRAGITKDTAICEVMATAGALPVIVATLRIHLLSFQVSGRLVHALGPCLHGAAKHASLELLAGIVHLLDEMMETHGGEDDCSHLVSLALIPLALACKRMPALLRSPFVKMLGSLRRYAHRPEIPDAECSALVFMLQELPHGEGAALVRKERALPVLLLLLRKHMATEKGVWGACEIINRCSVDAECRELLVKLGAVKLLREVLDTEYDTYERTRRVVERMAGTDILNAHVAAKAALRALLPPSSGDAATVVDSSDGGDS